MHTQTKTGDTPPTEPPPPDSPPQFAPPVATAGSSPETLAQRTGAPTYGGPAGGDDPHSGRRQWYRRWWVWALGVFVLLGVIGALSGEDKGPSTDDDDEATAEITTTSSTPTVEEKPTVAVKVSNRDRTVRGMKRITVRGTAPTDAKVRVNGFRTKRDGRRFSRSVKLAVGDNVIPITGSAPGQQRFEQSILITRRLSAAEKAAIRARKKQRFLAAAKSIPYKQLEKNADRYSGDKVCYRGQIFQIQEEGNSGGILLLSVTDEGYGIWDDNIWVNYNRSIRSAEDDIISVCGTVVGSRSYETQIGGETYVPEVDARYISE